jgi:tetratricopeptide (TPR) repeat protein
LLDQADLRLVTLSESGTSLSSEASQFDTLTRQFHKKGPLFLKQAGGIAAIEQARQDHPNHSSNDWWMIDEIITAQRQATIRRWVLTGGIAVILLLVVGLLYQRFLAPDPEFQAGIGYQQNAENKLIQGDFEGALAEVNEALPRLPEAIELLILRGVIYEMLGQTDLAEMDFNQAQADLEQAEHFYALRARFFIMANQPEQTLMDAQTALEINPDLASVHMYMGQAYELLGDYQAAMDSYETASEIAQATGNPQLDVMARMQLANLLQAVPMLEMQNMGEAEE